MKISKKFRQALRSFVFARQLVLEQAPRKLGAFYRTLSAVVTQGAGWLIPLLVGGLVTLIIYTVGFMDFYGRHDQVYRLHAAILTVLEILYTLRFIFSISMVTRWRSRLFNLLLVALVFYLAALAGEIREMNPGAAGFTAKKLAFFSGVVFLFITEVSQILRFIYRRGVNPALLFVASFAAFIIIGGFMLMLPNATTDGIHPVDAFFTSASAVCVTGLIVVDTATAFTQTGKVIILFLIQIGGLGIMTFAGMISFLVTGTVSFQNQLALRDMLSSSRMSNVISFISRVVLVTFTFEAFGAFLIFGTLSEDMFRTEGERIFFAMFHAVSAFCNAGFSTLTDGLYDGRVRFHYKLHWIIAMLVMMGGLGFPIVFNIFTFVRIRITNMLKRLLRDPNQEIYTNVLQTTARLSLTTYFILVLTGFIAYFGFEYNHTLQEHGSAFGKITTSFFGSITPRTAGFNTVDITLISMPTLLIYLLLMWIGASPGSTGGGIKTTVAAVAFLNMKSIVSGQTHTEAFRSDVSVASIKRAFAIILLSLMVLGLTILLLSIYDSEMGLLKLAFEAFSAFSTVGLTLGVTPKLSLFGKIVIMTVMFIGRVGALTLLFAVITRSSEKLYRYPSEDVMF